MSAKAVGLLWLHRDDQCDQIGISLPALKKAKQMSSDTDYGLAKYAVAIEVSEFFRSALPVSVFVIGR